MHCKHLFEGTLTLWKRLRWIGILAALYSAGIRLHADESTNSFPPEPASRAEPAPAESERISAYKQMSLAQLMQQDVTSVSKAPEPYGRAPAAIRVVTSDEIKRFGATSIPEALRLADNLEVAQASSLTWHISARGFNIDVANKLLVLMDGRSIYSPLFSGVIWNMQDYLMPDLDRIEVISGPGGTLWGANAVNGVINIVSKDAKDTQGWYAEAGGGNWLEDFAGVRYGGTLASNVYFRVYGKYFDRGPQEFTDGKNAGDAWNRGQAGFRIDVERSDQNHFMLDGGGFGGNNGVMPGGEGSPKAEGGAKGGHLLGRWTHTYGDDSALTLQAYYDRTHLDAPFQGLNGIPPGTLYDDLDTVDLDVQDRFRLGERQRIVAGMEYRYTHDVNQAAPLVAFLPSTLDQNLFSGFLQDEIRVRDNVFLTLGSKIEHNDYTGVEYEPSARLQWNVTDRQMLWGAISRAVRTPSRYDRDLFEPSPAYGQLLVGNNSFQSENVIAYELGYRAQLARQVSGSISAFYNDYDHVRSLNLSGSNSLPIVFRNNLTVQTYGFEAMLDWQAMSWWRLHFGYDLLKEDVTVGPGGDLAKGLNETADPQQQVFVRSSMDLPANTELSAAFRWIDTVHNSNFGTPGTIPAYAEVDARFAWHATKHLELSIVGQNLVHDSHVEAGFPNSAQEAIVRSVFGKVTFTW